jgi:hypothetical protein
MLNQTVLFIMAQPALAHRFHDNPKIRLSGTAPSLFKRWQVRSLKKLLLNCTLRGNKSL